MDTLEKAIKDAQEVMNAYIQSDYQGMVDSLSLKVNYMKKKELRISYLEAELDAATTELAHELRENHSIISSIYEYTDQKNFLWNSNFIEELTSDERKKYITCNHASINYQIHHQQLDIFTELPYFSVIKRFTALSKYVKYIDGILKQLGIVSQAELPTIEKPNKKPVSEKPKAKRTLEPKLDEEQLTLLANCLNEINVFKDPITQEGLINLFSCNLSNPLNIARNKNKLLVYFLWQLESRSYITMEWQAVSAQEKLFYSDTDIILSQNNLSSLLYQVKESPPKDCHIIDKYIKELKEH
ncbi:MAG: hypothetical protein LBQ39_04275 [Tannerellaceae bacterium]|jgi:hypothetical protein|nr:hypothetical protein [Tannerellaceae bacterium]